MKLPKTTTSTLALCVALSLSTGLKAQQIDNLSIQATTLDNALLSLAQHSEIQILFSDPRIKQKLAPKLEGNMDVQDALSTLLKGTGFTYKRYDFTKEAADEFQLSIIPEGDLVPKIDEQLGLQQYFVNPEGCTPANAFCHALASTLRVITANCGDKLGRRVVSTRQDHC